MLDESKTIGYDSLSFVLNIWQKTAGLSSSKWFFYGLISDGSTILTDTVSVCTISSITKQHVSSAFLQKTQKSCTGSF